jgi:hypothetical protein
LHACLPCWEFFRHARLNEALDGSAQRAVIQSPTGGQILQVQFSSRTYLQDRVTLSHGDAQQSASLLSAATRRFYLTKLCPELLDRFVFPAALR